MDGTFVNIHKAKIIVGDKGLVHRQRLHRLERRDKIHHSGTVLIIVGAVAQQQQIFDFVACATVQIEHAAEIADGRDVLGTTRELIVHLLGRGNHDVQFRIDAVVDGFHAFGLRDETFIGQNEVIYIPHTM